MELPSVKRREITKEFLEKDLVREPIEDFKVTSGSSVGDNVAGELRSITVNTQKGQRLSLVFKGYPDDPEQLAYVVENKVFRLETTVYKILFPSIQKLLSKANQPTDLPVPQFIAGYNDEVNDYLCLEDVRPKGYKMLDKHVGLGKVETTMVLQQLARFHALTYYLIRYEGEKYFDGEGDIGILNKNLWTSNVEWESVTHIFGAVVELGLEFIHKEDPNLAAKVRQVFSSREVNGRINRSTALKTDDLYFPCIVHGDLWTNNIMFKYVDGQLVDIIFIDFQQTHRGNIYEDLQYFLLTSTTPADRRTNLSQWLEEYYFSFVKTLESINCPKPQNFTRGFFIGEMWNCFLSGYAYLHFAIPFHLGIFTPAEGEIDEPLPELTPGGPPSMMEVGAIMCAKFRKWVSRSPAAKTRLLDVTRELVEYGVI